jgi:hypothetical protein
MGLSGWAIKIILGSPIIFELVRCEKFEPQDSQLSSMTQIFDQRPATELLVCVEQLDIREARWEIYE